MIERLPISQEQGAEPDPLVYSREAYEQVLKLVAEFERHQQHLERSSSEHKKELENDQRIYSRTHSLSRKEKLESHQGKVNSIERLLDYNRERLVRYRESLHRLYELAHEEALRENRKVDDERMQKVFERILELEGATDHLDPDHIPSAETLAALGEEYDAKAGELVAYAVEVFKRDKEASS